MLNSGRVEVKQLLSDLHTGSAFNSAEIFSVWKVYYCSDVCDICHGFPPPQATLVTVASGENGLWVV